MLPSHPFLDWGLAFGFFLNLTGGDTPLYDGGDRPFSTTTLSTIGQTVVKVLRHLNETKNRSVFVQDLVTTQNEILAIAQRIRPDRIWTPKNVSTAEMENLAQRKYSSGAIDLAASVGFFCRSVFAEGYGGEFQRVDNELLDIPQKTQADLEALIKSVLSNDN
ncbi:uncharacterized protein N7459_000802 [Penicillium hispanicum]|uniref:uncharacterized protein n=1 Tax=Penicillium hispanicum TaxID=1080232 RepID=UPI0025414EBA|nr:uncharacterized protein N7459_000802 [Penicillium hispanicum]KAJ5594594.1 hypothetical protein N7459_000802 [Penicillium hispanicum]